MKATLKPVLAVLFLVGIAGAQDNRQIQSVAVARSDSGTQVQVNLSAPGEPKVIVAANPPRLVLEFAATTPGATQPEMQVGQDGVLAIRIGQHSAKPPITRVVIVLDSARPYELSRVATQVVLTVLPAVAASRAHSDSGAPGAAGVPLFGRLHRPRHKTTSVADRANPQPLPPAPKSEPIVITDLSSSSATPASSTATKPTAAHPNFGSLQEGTVFPNSGAPGTGVVPAATNSGASEQPIPSSARVSPVEDSAVTAEKNQPAPQSKYQESLPAAQSKPEDAQVTAPATPVADQTSVAQTMTVIAPEPKTPAVSTPAATPVTVASDTLSQAPAPTTDNSTLAASASPSPTPTSSSPAETQLPTLATRQPNADLRTAFKVKYVAEGAAYLDAGRSAGLANGMKLEIHDTDTSSAQATTDPSGGVRVVAQLKIISVAETSAVADIIEPTRDVKPGDLAYLSSEDTESLVAQRSLSPTRKYPAVISFTDGDPVEEEAREEVPRPPLPEVNRARGRIGFDYSGLVSHGQFASTSSNLGMVVRTDVTRIGGTYWNMSGYWRGRFTSNSASSQPTLQDLINRTYTIGLTYDNPKSPWVAGVGRLYLPWATSLDTIDGGYVGRKVSDIATVGLFAGSTPDPTSWSYAPDQQMSGMFVNFQGGSFDTFRYSSTSGAGIQMLKWKINRPFVFFENGLYYKRLFSLYSAVQADKPASNPVVTSPGAGISRSFTTLRIQPIDRFEFDVNHTYFRDVPNFDPQLIGTGLLDKYLFQGFSAGPRIEVLKQVWVYATLGKSNRSGDAKSSLNQLYGVTFANLPFRFHADIRYSRFNSSFGDGDYKAVSISRNFRDSFRWEVLLGQQSYASSLAASDRSKFVNANIEAPLGPHYFLQGGWTVNRGGTLNYDQWFTTFGYRFDSWHRRAK